VEYLPLNFLKVVILENSIIKFINRKSKKHIMRKIVFLLSYLIFAGFISCQQFHEPLPGYTVKTPDQVVSNDSVPDVYTVESPFQKVIVARFKHQTDILDGLRETVKRENIKNAVILSGIGSVTSYHLHSVSNSTFPTENVFMKKDDPMDLLSVNGYIFNGRVHAHLSLSNEDYAIGGHLEPGTKVFTFCIITLGILDENLQIERFDDTTLR
jgi:predicted DNA-binding protein with PD1-like motif